MMKVFGIDSKVFSEVIVPSIGLSNTYKLVVVDESIDMVVYLMHLIHKHQGSRFQGNTGDKGFYCIYLKGGEKLIVCYPNTINMDGLSREYRFSSLEFVGSY